MKKSILLQQRKIDTNLFEGFIVQAALFSRNTIHYLILYIYMMLTLYILRRVN